jgi:hypothetical protein
LFNLGVISSLGAASPRRGRVSLNLTASSADTSSPGDCAFRTQTNVTRHYSAWWRCAFQWPASHLRANKTAPARLRRNAGAANLEAGFLPGGANLPEAWNRRLPSRTCSIRTRLHAIGKPGCAAPAIEYSADAVRRQPQKESGLRSRGRSLRPRGS